jgi:hypothetical protein
MRIALPLLVFGLVSCSAESSSPTDLGTRCGDDATVDSGTTDEEGGLLADALPETVTDTGINCEPPDVLVLLDRTMTMHFRPDGTETPAAENDATGRKKTKFAIAIDALRSVFTTYDTQVRFGLELWPRERDNCITVKTRIDQSYGTPAGPPNPSCERGEIRSAPGLGNASGMAALLDVETTPLCLTTPLAAALDTAGEYLAGIKLAKRSQYLLLVTDGADYDLSCPTPDPIAKLSTLADSGLKTFVVGFGADASASGVDPVKMNKLACAAQTAKDFATACKKGATGVYEPVDATGAKHLYYEATDKASLDASLGAIAASLGCRSCLK